MTLTLTARPPPATPGAPMLDLPRIVGPDWDGLDADVRRRFAPSHAPALYPGTLTTRFSRIGALFARIGAWLGRPLPLRAGQGIPAEVHVRPGAGGVVWERWLLEPGRSAVCVRSTKYANTNGGVCERTDRLLGMSLHVTVEGGALVFTSQGYFLALSRTGRRLPLPGLITPGRCQVTHAPAGPGRFRFTLSMTHPLWGTTVTQDGIFHDAQGSIP